MNPVEALELVELRINEDHISWAEAFNEYRYLTGQSISQALTTGEYLRNKYRDKGAQK